MQEAGNHPLLVEPGARRKIQQVDPVEFAVLALVDQPLDGVGHLRIGGLPQHCEQRAGFSHGGCTQRGVMRNIGERSGCVVTTPTGSTGSLSSSSTRNAPMIFASASTASTSAKCAPTQMRGPTPNGR